MKTAPDFVRKVYEQHSIESIDNMLRNSFLFTEPGHSSQSRLDDTSSSSINGEYLKMLKSFLNTAWEPILIPQGEETKEMVMYLTLEVLLKNPIILEEVWKQIGAF